MNVKNIKNNIADVFAAHPDDEILGSGATFAKLVDQGKEVHAFIICEAESVRYSNDNIDLTKDAEKAASIIGFSSITFLNMPEQRLDSLSLIDINQKIESILNYIDFSRNLNYYSKQKRGNNMKKALLIVALFAFGFYQSHPYSLQLNVNVSCNFKCIRVLNSQVCTSCSYVCMT